MVLMSTPISVWSFLRAEQEADLTFHKMQVVRPLF